MSEKELTSQKFHSKAIKNDIYSTCKILISVFIGISTALTLPKHMAARIFAKTAQNLVKGLKMVLNFNGLELYMHSCQMMGQAVEKQLRINSALMKSFGLLPVQAPPAPAKPAVVKKKTAPKPAPKPVKKPVAKPAPKPVAKAAPKPKPEPEKIVFKTTTSKASQPAKPAPKPTPKPAPKPVKTVVQAAPPAAKKPEPPKAERKPRTPSKPPQMPPRKT